MFAFECDFEGNFACLPNDQFLCKFDLFLWLIFTENLIGAKPATRNFGITACLFLLQTLRW